MRLRADGVTEKMIMETIHEFSRQKTIIQIKDSKMRPNYFFIDKGQVD